MPGFSVVHGSKKQRTAGRGSYLSPTRRARSDETGCIPRQPDLMQNRKFDSVAWSSRRNIVVSATRGWYKNSADVPRISLEPSMIYDRFHEDGRDGKYNAMGNSNCLSRVSHSEVG